MRQSTGALDGGRAGLVAWRKHVGVPLRRGSWSGRTGLAALGCVGVLAGGCSDCGGPPPATDAAPGADGGDGGRADGGEAGTDAAGTDAAPCDLFVCPYDEIAPPIDFDTEIQDIFDSYCAYSACHGAGMAAGMQLSPGFACASIVNQWSTESPLDRIEPGDPESSYLYYKLRGTHLCPPAFGEGSRMPLAAPCLDPLLLGRVRAWIVDGAPCTP